MRTSLFQTVLITQLTLYLRYTNLFYVDRDRTSCEIDRLSESAKPSNRMAVAMHNKYTMVHIGSHGYILGSRAIAYGLIAMLYVAQTRGVGLDHTTPIGFGFHGPSYLDQPFVWGDDDVR